MSNMSRMNWSAYLDGTPQSDYGGGRRIGMCSSILSYGGKDRISFYNRSTEVGKSSKSCKSGSVKSVSESGQPF